VRYTHQTVRCVACEPSLAPLHQPLPWTLSFQVACCSFSAYSTGNCISGETMLEKLGWLGPTGWRFPMPGTGYAGTQDNGCISAAWRVVCTAASCCIARAAPGATPGRWCSKRSHFICVLCRPRTAPAARSTRCSALVQSRPLKPALHCPHSASACCFDRMPG